MMNARRFDSRVRPNRMIQSALALVVASLFPIMASATAGGFQNAEPDATGVYKVPVSEDLEPFASFPIKLNNQDYIKDTGGFTFELPKELVGRTTKIAISQQEDGGWSGPQADGTCISEGSNEAENFTCQLRFHDLDIDMDLVEKEIFKSEPDLSIAKKKIEVAKKFSTEPIGILIYSLPRAPRN